MKSRILFVLLSFTITLAAQRDTCSMRGIPLYGRVRVVNSFPTFKVRIVTANADYNIMLVKSFPDRCARWQFVTSHEDFTVQFVTSHEDFTIRYVTSFPGKH